MKKTILFAAGALAVFSAFGQITDTTYTTIGQTDEPFEKTRFIDRYEQVFGTQTPTRFLLKWNTLALLPLIGHPENAAVLTRASDRFAPLFDLRAEVKLAPMLSVQVAGAYFRQATTVYQRGRWGADLRVEPRWYFDMPRRIRAGTSADNLTGNYFGLEGRHWRRNLFGENIKGENYAVSLRFGMQRRLWRYGFIDLNYGMGYQRATHWFVLPGFPVESLVQKSLFGEARVAVGLALGGGKPNAAAEGSACDVFQCFQEADRMLKVDLYRVLRLDPNHLLTNPSIAFEQKIGDSPFSVEVEAEFYAEHTRNVPNIRLSHPWVYGAGGSVQPRFYFLQKRQIARGQSGNNLNGPFLGCAFGYLWNKRGGFVGAKPYSDLYTAPHVGIQYRLFRNGFVQYKFGLTWNDVQVRELSVAEPSFWYSDLKIGVAF